MWKGGTVWYSLVQSGTVWYSLVQSGTIWYQIDARTGREGPEREWRYSSTVSLTSSLNAIGWSTPRPGRSTPRKEVRYPLYRRLGGPQGRSGPVRKTSPTPGLDPRTVQPVEVRKRKTKLSVFRALDAP